MYPPISHRDDLTDVLGESRIYNDGRLIRAKPIEDKVVQSVFRDFLAVMYTNRAG